MHRLGTKVPHLIHEACGTAPSRASGQHYGVAMREGVRVRRGSGRLGSTVTVSVAALAVLVIPSGAGASAAPVEAPTPAHWWQAGGSANDTPGPGIGPDNGTLEGAGFAPGPSGAEQAFNFGGGGQQVVFNRVGGNRGTGAFTFAFDVKMTATPQQAVWEKRMACNTNGTPFWGFRMNGSGTLAGSIDFEYGTYPTSGYAATSTTSVDDGAWHQVAVTRHGVTVNLYIDGTLEATVNSPATANVNNSAQLRAGVSTCDGVDGTHSFTGELAELMIFRSALTESQIQALGMSQGLTG